jgi:hypothetical protein
MMEPLDVAGLQRALASQIAETDASKRGGRDAVKQQPEA